MHKLDSIAMTSGEYNHGRAAARSRSLRGGTLGALLAAFAFAGLLCVDPAPADGRLELLGVWGGVVNSVFIDEAADPDIAYVAAGRRLVILNVADPANIIELGSIDVAAVADPNGDLDILGDIADVVVRDGLAYVAMGRLAVVDVADPTDPQLVWCSTRIWTRRADQVRLNGDFAYVRNNDDLQGFDISDPRNPIWRGNAIRDTPNIADFVIKNGLIYILYDAFDGNSAAGVKIADVTIDPLNLTPYVLGSVRIPLFTEVHEKGLAIDVEGDLACVTIHSYVHSYGYERVAVVDVSEPEAPFVAGSFDGDDFAGRAADAALHGGLAYVAEDGNTTPWDGHCSALRVFDIATAPGAPQQIGAYEFHGAVSGVEVFGDRAYAMDRGEGLVILSLWGDRGLTRLGGWHSPAELQRMDKVGDQLYITDTWNGFTVLDVAEHGTPLVNGVYQTAPDGLHNWGIKVRDGFAYLSAGYSGIDVVNVNDAANPVLAGSARFSSSAASAVAMELGENTAHVGVNTGSGGLMMNFRIINHSILVQQGSVALIGPPLSIDVSPAGIGAIGWLSGGGGGLATVSTVDPNDPELLFDCHPGGVDLARSGDVVYAANELCEPGYGGLHIYDVADPASPVRLNYFPTYRAYGVALQGNFAYFTGDDPDNLNRTTLFVLDVSDPQTPTVVTKTLLCAARSVLVDGCYIYVALVSKGLIVMQYVLPGDMNCDGGVDNFDIAPFALALTDPTGYALAYPGCGIANGDINGDGALNNFDVGPFVSLLCER
ncbi:MAG: hypothetical protein PVJ57_22580 [Phycisphaerae bacterium]|jgi:hypothetical protein